MGKPYVVVLLVSSFILVPAFSMIDAFGHGISSGPISRPIAIDNEQFSAESLTTGDVVVINGEVISRVNRPVTLVPYVYVDHDAVPPYTNLLATIYPLVNDQSTWYFRVEHNLPNSVKLGPGEAIPYEIKLYPLKAGSYHIHTYFLADFGPHLGRGATVLVSGQDSPTAGEITQLYLPLTFGIAAIGVLTLAVLLRTDPLPVKEKAIRIYYAIKSSFETMWLSGVLFWLAAASYLATGKYAMLIGVVAVLAAVTFGGYVAVTAKSRTHQRLFAIGTSTATVALYFVLPAGDSLAIANQFRQFSHNGIINLVAIIANILAAVLISMLALKERNKPAKIVHQSNFFKIC